MMIIWVTNPQVVEQTADTALLPYDEKGERHMEIYNKRQLATKMASEINDLDEFEDYRLTRRRAEAIVTVLLDIITEELCQGNGFKLNQLGQFKVLERPKRVCKHPITGEQIEVGPTKYIKFCPSTYIKNTVKYAY